MNTFQLTCFLTVAETLNFARAAEQLNITQPAVTHQIRSLETELNVKLFKRTTRTVEMTRAGNLFLNDAKEMIAISLRAKNRFEHPSQQEIEIFSIGSYSHSQFFSLSRVLRRMAQIHPYLHPRLEVMPFQHLYRSLEEENVDVVVGFREPEGRKAPGIYKELKKVPMVCVCASDHPISRSASICMEELKKEKLVINDPVRTPAQITQLQGRLMGGRASSDFYFCQSAEAAMVLAESGFGIALLPELLVNAQPYLETIPVEDIPPLSFGVYYKSLQGNAPLKSFINIMKEYVKEEE